MYALYKVEVWIKANLDSGTPFQKILTNVDNIPSGKVDFIEDENYLTETEVFIKPVKSNESTLKIYNDRNELLYTNEKK